MTKKVLNGWNNLPTERVKNTHHKTCFILQWLQLHCSSYDLNDIANRELVYLI
jgi:hypothetical protein